MYKMSIFNGGRKCLQGDDHFVQTFVEPTKILHKQDTSDFQFRLWLYTELQYFSIQARLCMLYLNLNAYI